MDKDNSTLSKPLKPIGRLTPIEPKPTLKQVENIPTNRGWLQKPLPPIQRKKSRAILIDPRIGKKSSTPMKNVVDVEQIDAKPILDDDVNYAHDLKKDIEDKEACDTGRRTRERNTTSMGFAKSEYVKAMDPQEYRMFAIESAFKTRDYPWKVEEVEYLMGVVPEENHEAIKKLWFKHNEHNIAHDQLRLFTKILPEEIKKTLGVEGAPIEGLLNPTMQKVDQTTKHHNK
jgi:hypothetical protein